MKSIFYVKAPRGESPRPLSQKNNARTNPVPNHTPVVLQTNTITAAPAKPQSLKKPAQGKPASASKTLSGPLYKLDSITQARDIHGNEAPRFWDLPSEAMNSSTNTSREYRQDYSKPIGYGHRFWDLPPEEKRQFMPSQSSLDSFTSEDVKDLEAKWSERTGRNPREMPDEYRGWHRYRVDKRINDFADWTDGRIEAEINSIRSGRNRLNNYGTSDWTQNFVDRKTYQKKGGSGEEWEKGRARLEDFRDLEKELSNRKAQKIADSPGRYEIFLQNLKRNAEIKDGKVSYPKLFTLDLANLPIDEQKQFVKGAKEHLESKKDSPEFSSSKDTINKILGNYLASTWSTENPDITELAAGPIIKDTRWEFANEASRDQWLKRTGRDISQTKIVPAVSKATPKKPKSKTKNPLDQLDSITQARDIHGNEVKTADMLAGGGIKLQKTQRAGKKTDSGLQFRNIGGQVRIVGKSGPETASEAELPNSMGQTQPKRVSPAKSPGGMR